MCMMGPWLQLPLHVFVPFGVYVDPIFFQEEQLTRMGIDSRDYWGSATVSSRVGDQWRGLV